MKVFDLRNIKADGASVETFLQLAPTERNNMSSGVATFSAGVRHPQRGTSAHEQHEISCVIEGRLELDTKLGRTVVERGQVIWFEANEKHASTAMEDCTVFWVLFG